MNTTVAIGVASVSLGIILSSCLSTTSVAQKKVAPIASATYPYASDRFTQFVADSYKVKGSGSSQDFYSWFDAGFEKAAGRKINAYLDNKRATISSITDSNEKLEEECDFAADVHRIVKKVIPKFSLQHGFEFYQAKDLGERQCFLQSVLVCGLLQRGGVESGVVMVYKNIAGEATNNGHAVAVARLSNGDDVLVDCSDPTPFVEHKGLFMRSAADEYAYVNPKYEPNMGGLISGYRREGTAGVMPPSAVGTLDLAFLDSMFDYYRGERAPGGFFETPTTKAGLAKSAEFLQKSIRDNPKNPLAVYMLGHILEKQGKKNDAMMQYSVALNLYQEDGWIPQGLKDAMAH